MAESITIKALQDASLDAKSLEEVVNGNESKQITTRLGETYPSVKKAIKAMFENGGLPAKPFKTKALMTASSLLNGDYAQVTDGGDDNGLYLKEGGVWVKSAYDPLYMAKVYTDAKISQSVVPKAYLWSPVSLGVTTSNYIDNAGTISTSAAYTMSDFIAVEKGDNFVLTNIKDAGTGAVRATFILYDNSKNLVGILSAGRTTLTKGASKDAKLVADVNNINNISYASNAGVIVPQNGFIKVGFINNTDNTTLLFRTDIQGLAANTLTHINKDDFKLFGGLMQSVVIDKDFATLGISNSATVGNPISGASVGTIVSKRYAVKAGQYVSFHGSKALPQEYSVWLVDGSDNYIANLDKLTELSHTKAQGGIFHGNLEVPQDGFIRFQASLNSRSLMLFAIHDEPINVTRREVADKMNILFYENGYNRPTDPKLNYQSSPIWSQYAASASNDNVTVTASKPYLLKAGRVLEYSLDATIDAGMFLVMPTTGKYATVGAVPDSILQINANEIFDLYTAGVAHLASPSLIYVGDAKSGSAAYCNENEDTVIVFLRPRKASSYFTTHKSSESYSVSVMTKDEYITKRNKGLKERFKKLSKFAPDIRGDNLKTYHTANDDVNYSGSYPSILMFKGEVLQCITGSRALPYALSLGKSNGTVTKKTATQDSVFILGYRTGAFKLPIRTDDTNSFFHTQVYARETANVIVSFTILDAAFNTLDIDGMIASQDFEPRIMQLKDVVVGGNIKAGLNKGRAYHLPTSTDAGRLTVALTANDDSLLSFIPKGTYIEYGLWVSTIVNKAVYAPLNNTKGIVFDDGLPNLNTWKRVRLQGLEQDDVLGQELPVGGSQITTRMGHYFDEDVVVAVVSETAGASAADYALDTYNKAAVNNLTPAIIEGEAAYYSVHKTMLKDNYTHLLRSITKAEYDKNYRVTSDTFINIPDIKGLNFNFCEDVSSSLINEQWSVVQIRRHDKVLAVVNCLTANQGQSSAGSVRKNINMEFYNNSYKKVMVRFGDNIPEQEVVLKSYIVSDKGHFKDSLAAKLWYEVRTANPLPVGGVFPNYVFRDTSEPLNQLAKGTTFGFPAECYRGGNFYSLASLRNKKKTPNYAMNKDNLNHILIQPDAAFIGVLNWDDIQLANFEVRNPKMVGYEDGDNALPEAYADVEVKLRRLIDWMQGVINKTININDTYAEHIDLESFIDYGIGVNVLYHWDSMVNNFLLGTHDGVVWYAYWYDGDRTWGSSGETKYDYMPITLNFYKSIFREVAASFPDLVKQRYKLLRDKGVLNVSRQQKDILDMTNSISPESRKLDAKYWGAISEAASAPYAMEWYYHRLNAMDIYYSYKASSNIMLQDNITVSKVAAGATKTVTLTATGVVVGNKVSIVFGGARSGLVITHAITVNDKIDVSFKNTSATEMDIALSYIAITKLS